MFINCKEDTKVTPIAISDTARLPRGAVSWAGTPAPTGPPLCSATDSCQHLVRLPGMDGCGAVYLPKMGPAMLGSITVW